MPRTNSSGVSWCVLAVCCDFQSWTAVVYRQASVRRAAGLWVNNGSFSCPNESRLVRSFHTVCHRVRVRARACPPASNPLLPSLLLHLLCVTPTVTPVSRSVGKGLFLFLLLSLSLAPSTDHSKWSLSHIDRSMLYHTILFTRFLRFYS